MIRQSKRIILIFTLLSIFPIFSFANSCAPYYGATFSYALLGKEPPSLRGYQLMLNYDPNCFKWRKFNIYFDGGFTHYWITNSPHHTNLNIYSIAPMIRYTFNEIYIFSPYIELSIGLAYLNHTRFDSRNLGMHFAFQDRMGIGIKVGDARQFSLGLHAVHYSNARLCGHNSGVTVPIELDLGYRFQ